MSEYPNVNVTPAKGDPAASELLAALTLRTLCSLETDRVGEIVCKLDRLTDLVLSTFRAEMARIDSTTNELAEQLQAIADGLPNADEAKRLRALAASLNGIGRKNIEIARSNIEMPSSRTENQGAIHGT